MPSEFSRREFIAGLGVLAASSAGLSAAPLRSSSTFGSTRLSKSPFKIAVINDEISQDFGRACEVAAQQFGMEWMELRSMWNKNIVSLDEKEVAETRRLLDKDPVAELKASLVSELSEDDYYKILEAKSVWIQNRVSPILKALTFQAMAANQQGKAKETLTAFNRARELFFKETNHVWTGN